MLFLPSNSIDKVLSAKKGNIKGKKMKNVGIQKNEILKKQNLKLQELNKIKNFF